MQVDDVRRYVALRQRQKELGAQSDAVKEEADELEQSLLEDFAKDSVDSMRVDGVTVYLSRQVWAKQEEGVDRRAIVDAFYAAGLDHMVTPESYNSQTVSAWLRDHEKANEPIPSEFDGLLTTSEVFKVKVRRS